MMASVDAEAEMENLFNDDDVHQDGGVENTQSLTQEEGEFTPTTKHRIDNCILFRAAES